VVATQRVPGRATVNDIGIQAENVFFQPVPTLTLSQEDTHSIGLEE